MNRLRLFVCALGIHKWDLFATQVVGGTKKLYYCRHCDKAKHVPPRQPPTDKEGE